MDTLSDDRAASIAAARAVKASKIAQALRDAGGDAASAAHLDATGRKQAERQAQTRPASAATWRIVVEMLAASERERALCPWCGLGDPGAAPGLRKPAGHAGVCSQ